MADDFLSRWSRRKRRVEEAQSRPEPDPPVGPAPSAEALPDVIARPGEAPESADPAHSAAEASAELTEEEIAALPSLDSFSAASDLGPFLRAGVPSALRNAALRRMWSLDPSIRDFVSEAREYAYDWNSPGGVPGLGPLLPGDDVEAMLRRIIGKPADAPVDEAEASETEDPASESEPFEADLATADPGATNPAATLAHSDTAEPSAGPYDAIPRDPVAAEEAPVPAVVFTQPEPMARPRMRRHGGALPG